MFKKTHVILSMSVDPKVAGKQGRGRLVMRTQARDMGRNRDRVGD